MTKVLVLGANGQLGSDILKVAEQYQGIDCVPVYRADCDVSDTATLYQTLVDMDFDCLINTTSYHKTDEVESNADLAIQINAHAPREMAKACAAKGARFIHISTDYVFGGNAQNSPLSETASTAPLNVYGASKVMGECLARTVNPDTVIFRVASLFGVAGASGKGGNFVETMIRVGKERGELKVVADQYMSPTSTADIADMLFRFIEKEGAPGIYHAVNTGQASWYEFASEIIKRANIDATVSPIPSSEFPTPAMRPPYSVLDNQKLVDIIGPIRTWEDALVDYLQAKHS